MAKRFINSPRCLGRDRPRDFSGRTRMFPILACIDQGRTFLAEDGGYKRPLKCGMSQNSEEARVAGTGRRWSTGGRRRGRRAWLRGPVDHSWDSSSFRLQWESMESVEQEETWHVFWCPGPLPSVCPYPPSGLLCQGLRLWGTRPTGGELGSPRSSPTERWWWRGSAGGGGSGLCQVLGPGPLL